MRNMPRKPDGQATYVYAKVMPAPAPPKGFARRPKLHNARYRRRRSRHGTMGDAKIVRGVMGEEARGLLGRIKRGGAESFEIDEGEDAGAKLRECPVISQCKTAHFLGCFFFAVGFDFAPVVLGIPLAVGPMLHLVGSPCLHRVPPMFRARGGYKSFLATIGHHASTIVNSLAVVLPFSNRGRDARQKPVVHGRIVAPAVVNESLTRPNHRLFFVPVLLLARSSRRAARLVGASPAVCGRPPPHRSFVPASPAAAHMASAFCSRVTQYSHARSTPREPRLWPPHFSTSPGESGPSVPIAIARSCSSALRVV